MRKKHFNISFNGIFLTTTSKTASSNLPFGFIRARVPYFVAFAITTIAASRCVSALALPTDVSSLDAANRRERLLLGYCLCDFLYSMAIHGYALRLR